MNVIRWAMLGAACVAAIVGAAMAPAEPTLEGVYYGFRTDQLNNKVKVDHYTFLADGRAFRGYPTEGLAREIDWDYECRFAECGDYRRRGNEVIFHNAASGDDTRFSIDSQGVLRRPGSTQGYRPMHLLDGMALEGTWGVFDPDAPMPIVALSLTEQGRFSEEGLLPYLSWADLGSDSASRASRAVSEGTGTYAIRRGTLELRYDHGLEVRLMVALPPGLVPGRAPRTLHVNGAGFDRKP
ncbi:hypothetical protein [Brevundimonas sp. Root1423]|uniref:hypothetical protein n=1 Tax=Brevundimonas sp. Root1423 TaxID=1736462 RepID=UPI0006F76470|nr:hypothetical protein [Brevundimonas sp. Root1423]KQY89823.1 hypothetical protein ASD25_04650 [Brevundimonas sp. Root1423]